MKFGNLLKPGKIGTMELRNRMIMPAMGTNLANMDGSVNDVIVNYYARRANGGVGMVITEICTPVHGGRTPMTAELENISAHHLPGLSRIPHAIHSGGAKACMQLAHGGYWSKEVLNGEPPYTPSGIGFLPPEYETENFRIFTVADIKKLIQKYGEAAQRAKIAGFDAIEIHCAHGYLPLQFLSGYTNHRTDEYGGSIENRARFVLEIVQTIKGLLGKNFPLLVRLSAFEDAPGGVTLEEASIVAKMLQDAGVDAIHVTGGSGSTGYYKYFPGVLAGKTGLEYKSLINGVGAGYWMPPCYTPRGHMVHLAAAIKKAVTIPVIASCSIPPEMGEDILAKGDADFIAMGRQIIADPDYPNKIRLGKPETIRRCLRCNECINCSGGDNTGVFCSVNPEAGRDGEFYTQVLPASTKKKVAVIGGGPGGMQAAQTAAARGHDVTLFEKNPELGGALYYVSLPQFKSDYKDYLDYMVLATKNCGATIKTGIEATADMLKDFDTVIVATGAVTCKPAGIKGTEDSTILDPLKVLDNATPVTGENVIICGAGLVGCEVAMELGEKGKKITMVDMLPSVAPDMNVFSKQVLESYLAVLGIQVKVNHKIIEMTGDKVVCEFESKQVQLEGDSVVCALGLKSDRGLWQELQEKLEGVEVIPVGDVNLPRKVWQAVHEGFHAARRI